MSAQPIQAATLTSPQMLAADTCRRREELVRQMTDKFMRDNPEATATEIDAYVALTSVEVGLVKGR